MDIPVGFFFIFKNITPFLGFAFSTVGARSESVSGVSYSTAMSSTGRYNLGFQRKKHDVSMGRTVYLAAMNRCFLNAECREIYTTH